MKLKNINIAERMNHYQVAGLSLAIIEDGQISKTQNYGVKEFGRDQSIHSNTVFNACSVSKFSTSMLVMCLASEGLLDLDKDVNEILISLKLPDHHRHTRRRKVTLRNLLCHQSGIIDPEDSFLDLKSNDEVPSALDLLKGRTNYCKQPIEVNYEPGSDFHYTDAGFCLIQQVIEDVMQQPFIDIMQERILEPLKMGKSSFISSKAEAKEKGVSCGHNKEGSLVEEGYPIYPYPACSGLWTSSTDLATLVIELMNSLKRQSKIGLSASLAQEMIQSQGYKSWAGLGMFLDEVDEEVEISSLGWGEGFQCMMVGFPYQGTGLTVMTNTNLGVHQLKGIIGEIYQSMKL
ncbi:serine hydrolase domain-containing protein [Salinibacillus xinjiangensis]|uniref:Serine hydrolase n=1 Tax=Salinibacillus xinjiangensis TaxID=1229268 RepID=A0A6G1X505_9BACI|nr:serine hydrolase domain-containing protein [Salinibacillus xinjiangensis]MRG86083.1 serine hydrolase [Salinibacillus xinjiangensis]